MRKETLSIIFLIYALSFFSQTEKKEKYKSETFLHLKIGTTVNLNNQSLLKDLNGNSSTSFSFAKSFNFNPLAEVGFEFHFAKYLGLNFTFGFTQTRFSYAYDNTGILNSGNPPNYKTNGVITSNIPHLNFMPTFYLKNTRLMIGSGIYKYYFTFNPSSVGNLGFNLNSESLMFYNKISIMQIFKMKSHELSLTGSYFGFTKKFDNGFQLALGFVI